MQSEEQLLGDLSRVAGFADIPIDEIGDSRYVVRYSRTAAELDAVLRLRYEVFNLELGEGLTSSHATGRDEDPYDTVCRHLMVVERATGEVVGTYRLQTSAMAEAGLGFYSATEFDLTGLPEGVLADAVELGRACIAKAHRNTRVLFLLWRGLAAYATHNGVRYLFGCCSLPSQDEAEGRLVLDRLSRDGHLHPTLGVRPKPGLACAQLDPTDAGAAAPIPALFALYLKYGARVCGEPAVDREFRTIDFFVLFDVEQSGRDARRMFFER